jgi:hypothetical protein
LGFARALWKFDDARAGKESAGASVSQDARTLFAFLPARAAPAKAPSQTDAERIASRARKEHHSQAFAAAAISPAWLP